MEGRASRPRTFVVYDPAYERYGNNVPTALPRRYDAFLCLEETRTPRVAARPMKRRTGREPETFPSEE